MRTNKQVEITQAANGFIVWLLGGPQADQPPIATFEDSINMGLEMVRRFKKEENLENLGLTPDQPEVVKPKVTEPNLYVFPTWDQVSEFLEYHFK